MEMVVRVILKFNFDIVEKYLFIMEVAEFRKKIKPNIKLSIDGNNFIIKEVIKFRFDYGDFILNVS